MGKEPVFFDIDGTLLDYQEGINQIPSSCLMGLDALRKTHPTFIASGRTKCFIVDEILKYPFEGFITCNGAYVEYKNQCIYKKVMPQDAIHKAIELSKKIGAVLYLESRDCIYVYNSELKSHEIFAKQWEMHDNVVVCDFDPTQIEVYIAMMIAPNEESCGLIKSCLNDYFDVSQHVNQLSFDLTQKGENKAKGITEVCHYLHADLKEVYAFGDGNNDLEMISMVGHGIAMGNAVDALKEIAYDITDTVKNDGIYKALVKHGLVMEKASSK